MPSLLRTQVQGLRDWLDRLLPATENYVGVFVSYPKSGRTWLRVILDELGVTLRYTHDGARHSKPRPFEELALCRWEAYRSKPVVFLSRDPRDTAVSGYFQKALRRDGYVGTMGDFIRDPLHGVEKIVRYNLTWLERGLDLPAFLPVTYEEISASPLVAVRSIVAFVGRDFPTHEIERVVANNTFEKMQHREASGEYEKRYQGALMPGNLRDPESYKVRRGRVGGYVDYLSAEDIAYCDAILGRHRYFEKLGELVADHFTRRTDEQTRGLPTQQEQQD